MGCAKLRAVPVYLFTFHAYLSWLADRHEGYVRRDEGILPRDLDVSDMYSRNAKHDGLVLDETLQRLMIEEAIIACTKQSLHLHGASTDPSHVHLLVSWKSDKEWLPVRTALKTSLSRRLNEHRRTQKVSADVGPTLSRAGSRRHVRDRGHFDYLMGEYLPDHRGIQWYEDRGWCEKPE